MRRIHLTITITLVLVGLLTPTLARGEDKNDAPGGGTLHLAAAGTLKTLDPAKASSEIERQVVSNLFDQLFEHDHVARPFKLIPALAASLPTISKDGLTQTIRLREGVRFIDDSCFEGSKGRVVTAGDVRFCLLRMMDSQIKSPGQWMFKKTIKGLDAFVAKSATIAASPERYAYRETEGYPPVKGLEVVDDRTLRFHLTKPTPQLAWLLTSAWCSVYAPEAVRKYGKGMARRAVGTGPYKVVVFAADDSLLLRRNTHFRQQRYPSTGPRGADLREAGKLLPRNETVKLQVYRTPLQVWGAFAKGECDVAEVARDAHSNAVDPRTGTLLPALKKAGITLHRDPRLEVYYDAFNWLDPVVGGKAGEKGRAIRYAICLASDEVYSITRLYAHRAERLRGPILPEMSSFNPKLRNESMRGPDESEEEVLEIAREMLEEGGYGKDAPVPPITMHILQDRSYRVVFDLLKKQVARVGITLTAKAVSWADMQKVIRSQKAQMWSSSWMADYPDAQNFLKLFYSPAIPEPNYSNYRNKEVDELYEAARETPPGDHRDDLLNDIEEIVVRDCAWRYRFRRIRWTAVHPWAIGYKHNGIAPKLWKHLAVDEGRRAKAAK